MLIKQGLKLPIYHHAEGSDALAELGIQSNNNLEDCDVQIVIFYNINAISEYVENDKPYSIIHANGSEYVSRLTIKQLEAEIAKYNV